MSGQIVCSECGSTSMVASGVFEHGTWIHRLTCWTCRDCQAIVAFREADIRAKAEPPVYPGPGSSTGAG